ncbi:MAG: PKD domain-containing protein [Chloroflexi bacterium]|nr:PKD domain-containing protein [Chloroflexota bacterium]
MVATVSPAPAAAIQVGGLASVHFVDPSVGWSVGNAVILRTSDGGVTWTEVPGVTANLTSVHFASPSDGWAVGAGGAILHTSNGGVTWVAQSSGTAANLASVHFANASDGWVVGAGGAILRTSNGGVTWVAQSSGTVANLASVDFADASDGWVVGAGGAILRTSNGGATWVAQSSGTAANLASVDFANASDGWAVGAGGVILRTSNGGATWVAQSSGVASDLVSVSFADASVGCVAEVVDKALRTGDGGALWAALSLGLDGRQPTGIHLVDPSTGWLVTARAGILRTTNGCASWQVQRTPRVIETGPLDHVTISPSAATIAVQQAVQFQATSFDAQGNPRTGDTFTWSVLNPTAGSINQAGLFTAGSTPGTFAGVVRVQATSGAITRTATASVTVTPGPLDRVSITPTSPSVPVQQTVQFQATSFDALGNPRTGDTFAWSVLDALAGTINQSGLFTAGTKASAFPNVVRVQATAVDGTTRTANANVTVTPGPLDHVAISPTSTSVAVQQTAQFQAQAFDVFGNLRTATFAWSVLDALAGTINQSGLFTAGTKASAFPNVVRVQATAGGITKTANASVTVTPGPLDRVAVTPAAATVPVQGTAQFEVGFFDAFGNSRTGDTFAWSVLDATVGTITQAGLFTAGTRAGTFANVVRVQATSGAITRAANASVTVTPGPLDRVTISPTSTSVAVQQTVQFQAQAFDVFGNLRAATFAWSVLDPLAGTINQTGLFTAGTRAGNYPDVVRVQGTAESITRAATASVTVLPGPLDRVAITPTSVVLPTNTTAQFQASSFDAFGNPVTATFAWSVLNATAGSISPTGLFTAGSTPGTFAGVVRAQATIAGVTRSATATVEVVLQATARVGTAVVFQGTITTLPVELLNLLAPGLGSYSLRITYDPAVARLLRVEPGVAGMPDTADTSTPGVVLLADADLGGLTGLVRAASLVLEAIGAEDSATALDIDDAQLVMRHPDGSDIIPRSVFDGRLRITKVDFSATPRQGRAPLTIQFEDLTLDNPRAWDWVFFLDQNGNGQPDGGEGVSTSTQRSGQFNFSAGGDVSIQFRVTNDAGTKTVTRINYVRTLLLAFDATTLTTGNVTPVADGGPGPLTVGLRDRTVGTESSRLWTVVNRLTGQVAATSTSSTPSFVIGDGSDFNVTLDVTGPAGPFSLAKDNFIRTLSLAFDATTTTTANVAPLPDGSGPLTVGLADRTSGTETSREWRVVNRLTGQEVGRSTISTPSFLISVGSDFNVTLQVTGPAGTFSLPRTNFIRTLLLSFDATTPTAGNVTPAPDGPGPLDVGLRDRTSGTETARLWRVINALTGEVTATSTQEFPIFAVAAGGDFDVALDVTGPAGSYSISKFNLIRTLRLAFEPTTTTTANVTPVADGGPGPLTVGLRDNTEGTVGSRLWTVVNRLTGVQLGTSTTSTPSFLISVGSDFNVTLRVTGPAGTFSLPRADYIRTLSLLFEATSPTTGNVTPAPDGPGPLSVGLRDRTSGTVALRRWTSPGAATVTSTEATSSLVFPNGGDFAVTLQVTGPAGTYELPKPNFVRTIKAAFHTQPDPAVGTITAQTTTFTVLFFSDAGGTIASYSWDFDRNTSTAPVFDASGPNPSNGYTAGGTYNVTMRVTGAAGIAELTKPGVVTVNQAPIADFTNDPATPANGPAPVRLVDLSMGSPTSWLWTVTGSAAQTSTLQNPTFVFNEGGDFTVRLEVSNAFGSDSVEREAYVRVIRALFTANGTTTPFTIGQGQQVNFSSAPSQGTVTGWAWDFNGDGAFDSTAANPSFTYAIAGVFSVRLRVTGPAGSHPLTLSNLVTVEARPVADFDTVGARTGNVTPTSLGGPGPLTVAFQDRSTGSPTRWLWTVPGSVEQNSTLQNPTFTFNQGNDFDVTLRVFRTVAGRELASDPLTRSAYVRTISVDFDVAPTSTAIGPGQTSTPPVNFTDRSSGTVDQWSWRVRNEAGAVVYESTEQDPSHRFRAGGTYSVRLEVAGPGGSAALERAGAIFVGAAPQARFAVAPGYSRRGVAPHAVQFDDRSLNDPTQWEWDFGDGAAFSPDEDPAHTYVEGGAFDVTLTSTNAFGSDSITRQGFIHVVNAVLAVSGTIPSVTPEGGVWRIQPNYQVAFDASGSQGANLRYQWSFECTDPTTATCHFRVVGSNLNATPTYTYRALGTFYAAVKVSGTGGTETATTTMQVIQPPTARFTVDPTGGDAPEDEVELEDTSLGHPTSWLWEVFRDSNDNGALDEPGDEVLSLPGLDTEEPPEFVLERGGNYHVRLTVSNADGSDTKTQANAIKLVRAHFVATQVEAPGRSVDTRDVPPRQRGQLAISRGQTVNFQSSDIAQTASTIRRYYWDVNGDGKTDARTVDTSFRYNSAGTFWVTLTVEALDGSTSQVQIGVVVS